MGEEKDRHHYVTGLDGKGREFTWVWGRKGGGSGTTTRPELLLTGPRPPGGVQHACNCPRRQQLLPSPPWAGLRAEHVQPRSPHDSSSQGARGQGLWVPEEMSLLHVSRRCSFPIGYFYLFTASRDSPGEGPSGLLPPAHPLSSGPWDA